jgi:hypothetical protein
LLLVFECIIFDSAVMGTLFLIKNEELRINSWHRSDCSLKIDRDPCGKKENRGIMNSCCNK